MEGVGSGGRGFRPVTSVERTVRILEELGASREPQTLGALVRRVGVPKSTLHGILRTLERCGWVETDVTGLRFRIGAGSLQLGMVYVDTDAVVQRLAPVLDGLAATTGETIQLARLTGADVVYLARRDSTHPVRLVSAVGGRLPAHATALGKALLAHYPVSEVDRRLPRRLERLTERTVSTREQLHAALADTRARGWAVDHEEATDGLRCYAVALPSADPPIDALSISVPSFRMTEERERLIVASLLDAASSIGGAGRPGSDLGRAAERRP